MSFDVSTIPTRHLVPNWLDSELNRIDAIIADLHPYPFQHPGNQRDYICYHQNDYLRLSERGEVEFARANARRSSSGFLAGGLFQGSERDECQVFRELLADAFRAEAILLTSSGWSANVGLVEALAKPDTPIYLDQKAHASLWDGAKLSRGRSFMLRHNDPNFLEARIRRTGPGIVCIDAFYSTNGAVAADLEAYVEICEKTGSVLVLDEAHSFGMIGAGAGGLAVQAGLADRIPFRTTSFSKALGGQGGCIATNKDLAWFLMHTNRSTIFSSAPLPAHSAAHRKALEIARAEPWLGDRCMSNGALLRRELRAREVDTGPSECQILSIEFESAALVSKAYGMLRDRGILAAVFLPPAVPEGTGLLRFSSHANLAEETILETADAVSEVLDALGVSSFGANDPVAC